MRTASRLVYLVTALLLLANENSAVAETEQIDLKALAKKARPAVMLLVISDAAGKEIATGTGFLVSSDGKLITNHHVIEGGASAVAKAENGGLFPVEGVLASDPKNDLTLLKIKGKDLPFLKLGETEKIEVGTRVAIIGSPLGLEGTLSEGIISAIRKLMGDMKMLQVTAAISPGSSGSPVLNSQGEVVGVASALLQDGQSLNFAVPAETARALVVKADTATFAHPLENVVDDDDDKVVTDPDFRALLRSEEAMDYVTSLKRAKTLVHRYPKSSFAYYCLGGVYGNLNFHDDAIGAFKQAISLAPNYPEAWSNLGFCYEKAGRIDDAITAYKQAIKLEPDRVDAWQNLGICYAKAGRMDDAISANSQLIKIKPDLPTAWFNLGLSYKLAGRMSDAIAAYKQAIKLEPDNAEAWCFLGGCHATVGNHKDAIAALTWAIKFKADYAEAWYNLGACYKEMGRAEDAADAFQRAKKLKPELFK